MAREPDLIRDQAARTELTFCSVGEALRILRDRADELGITREGLDSLAGLAFGHSSKLLTIPAIKKPNVETLVLIAGALGYSVGFFEDEKALARAKRMARQRKLTRSREQHWRNAKPLGMLHAEMVRRGKLGASARMQKTTQEQRTRSARNAARARWRRPRVAR